MKFRVIPRDNGTWLCDVRGRMPDGSSYRKRVVAKVSTERAAQIFAEKHWQAVLAGEAEQKGKHSPRFRDFAETWMTDYVRANRLKPSGIEHKQLMLDAHLLPLLGDVRMSDIGQEHVQSIKAKLADRAPKTVNNVLVVLSKMLRCAHEWGKISVLPPVKLLRVEKKARSFLSVETYNNLIAGAAKAGKHAHALVLLAGDAGLRRGEIFALTWEDIDLQRRFIVVHRSRVGKHTSTTKGHSARHVPMTTALVSALAALAGRSGQVLPKLTAKRARDLVSAAEAAAELPKTGKLHILRHTYASHVAMAGESLYHLQAALGHQDHTTTQGYAHLAPNSLMRLAEAIDKTRGQVSDTGNVVVRKLLKSKAEVVGELGFEPTPDEDE